MVAGIADHDPKAARAAMARLLKDTDAIILTFLGVDGDPDPDGD